MSFAAIVQPFPLPYRRVVAPNESPARLPDGSGQPVHAMRRRYFLLLPHVTSLITGDPTLAQIKICTQVRLNKCLSTPSAPGGRHLLVLHLPFGNVRDRVEQLTGE